MLFQMTEAEQKEIIGSAWEKGVDVEAGVKRQRSVDGDSGEYTLTMLEQPQWLVGEGDFHGGRYYLQVAELRDEWRDYPVMVVLKASPSGRAIVDTY